MKKTTQEQLNIIAEHLWNGRASLLVGDGFHGNQSSESTRHRNEEHDMLNWLKATRKKMNAGELKPERIELFQMLLELGESIGE